MGYMDPPAGVVLAENQHYNPYFAGGAIGMAQALYDEVIIIFLLVDFIFIICFRS